MLKGAGSGSRLRDSLALMNVRSIKFPLMKFIRASVNPSTAVGGSPPFDKGAIHVSNFIMSSRNRQACSLQPRFEYSIIPNSAFRITNYLHSEYSLFAEAYAHSLGGFDNLAVLRNNLELSGNVLERNRDNLVVNKRYHIAVLLVYDKLGCLCSEAC